MAALETATVGSNAAPTGRGLRPVLIVAAVVGMLALAVLTLTRVLIEWPAHVGFALVLSGVLMVGVVIACLHPAAARRRDQVLSQVFAASCALTAVIVTFLFVVVGFGRVPGEAERSLVALAMVAAAIGGLMFEPVRRMIGDRARQLLSARAVEDPDAVLSLFSQRIRRDIPFDEVLLQVAEKLARTMALSAAEVWVGRDGILERRASVPDRGGRTMTVEDRAQAVAVRAGVTGPAWLKVWMPEVLDDSAGFERVAPLGFGGELLGLVAVERASRDFDAVEEEVLAELGRQMGLALHNTQLDLALKDSLDEVRRTAKELEASRRRLVTAADEQRRKIERDLHDGAQQHLVALSVGLNLASDIAKEDGQTAAAMLTELQGAVTDAIEELRALAHGIYPPLLRDNGLGAALRAAGARSPLDVMVDDGEVGRLSADIEAAVYFCCIEALQNAAKHAPNASVEIRLWTDAGGLFFEVADNGPGFDVSATTQSAGFTNMADRLGAIGGTVEWHSAPGAGTQVRGVVPLS